MILPRPMPYEGGDRYRGTPYYPMQVLNGLVQRKLDRQAPSSDYDETPVYFRRYVDASGVHHVQIQNMLRNRIATGWRFVYPGSGWFSVPQLNVPGLRVSGNFMRGQSIPAYTTRGPTPFTFQTVLRTPAAQSQNPGGVGQVNAMRFFNPMTG